eukprot:EG_transcript_24734
MASSTVKQQCWPPCDALVQRQGCPDLEGQVGEGAAGGQSQGVVHKGEQFQRYSAPVGPHEEDAPLTGKGELVEHVAARAALHGQHRPAAGLLPRQPRGDLRPGDGGDGQPLLRRDAGGGELRPGENFLVADHNGVTEEDLTASHLLGRPTRSEKAKKLSVVSSQN